MRRWRVCRLLVCAAPLAAVQPATARAAGDPFEAVNRRIHAFNQDVRAKVLGPMAELYLPTTTAEVRRGVTNALANLGEPISVLSGLAAGDLGLAANATARFGINSTLGLASVHNRAAAMGYPRRAFGIADAVCIWGVPSGPYLVIPLLGPSTLRDGGTLAASGAALSQALGPDVFLAWRTTDAFVGYAQIHRELGRTDAQSLDAYAVQRSAYLQRRAAVCPADQAGDLAGDADGEPEAP